MPIRLLIATIALSVSGLVRAQTNAEVRGIVLDSRDGQAVPQAFVCLDGKTAQTRSNAYGRFAFSSVQPGKHILEIVDPDYRSTRTEFSLSAGESKEFQISLKPHAYK